MRLALLLLVGIFAGSCSLVSTEPFVDTREDEFGNLILGDTPRNWSGFKESVDYRVSNELAGKRPEGGLKSWNEFWAHRISALRDGQEHYEKYIDYIVESRRANGLPELEYGT